MTKPTKRQVETAISVLRRLSDDAYAPKKKKEPPMNPLILGSGTGGATPTPSPSPTPTPTPSVGNLRVVNNKTELLAAIGNAVDGDEIRLIDGYSTAPFIIDVPAYTTATTYGVAIVGNDSQVVRIKIDGKANANVSVIGWLVSADAVNGSETGGVNSFHTGVYCRNSSKFSVEGCEVGQSWNGVYVEGCSNFNIENNVIRDFRNDGIQQALVIGAHQIKGNAIIDPVKAEKAWVYTDGTAPVFAADPGSGSPIDTDHPDCIQYFSLNGTDTYSDFAHLNNILDADAQLDYLGDGVMRRGKISGNSLTGSYPWFLRIQDADHIEVTDNDFAERAVMNPVYTAALIKLEGAATNIKVGRNTVPASVVYQGTTGPAFTSGTITGAATAPTAPSYLTTAVTVGDITAKKARPAYTKYAGAPIAKADQQIIGGPFSVGAKVTALPPKHKGYYYGIEDDLYTRWKLNGTIVRAVTQGRAAMVYTTAAAGTLTCEFSVDGLANWRACDGKTVS